MNSRYLFKEIQDHLDTVIAQDTDLGKGLWKDFILQHPADIADFISDLHEESVEQLFLKLPKQLQLEVFTNLSNHLKVFSLSFMNEHQRIDALDELPVEELTDLFDDFSDEELEIYLKLLNKKAREKVLSLMKFDPESAGGIMDPEVISFMQDFTVAKSIQVMQRLRPDRDIYQQIYITDTKQRLVGYINLEDLVLENPNARIQSFMKTPELIADVYEDRESVAKKMIRYGQMNVPVVDVNNILLGIIPSTTLVEVVVEEASEDVQKMAALAPMKYPYFETSFLRILIERGYILIALLLAQSFSTTIMKSFDKTLSFGMLFYFTTMLVSAGGNTSNQTSALVVQGLATGQLHANNIFRFLRREFSIASLLALALALVGFIRAYISAASLQECLVISCSLAAIVLVSGMLGAIIPLILKRLNVDPAFSAGPFLATLMDVLGILIYCYIAIYLIR